MSGNSYINATSTNPNAGDGGNINIILDNGFLIAAPGQDNDIIANAVGGNGGNISISALRLFGFSLQDEPDVARLRGNGSNDISASSEVGLPGAIALDTLDLDPSQGLIELPVDLTDRANQVTPGCGLGNTDNGSEFVVTGSGGLPPSPSDSLAANSVNVPWVVPDEGAPVAQVFEPKATAAAPLVEAQGIGVDAEGNIYFVAEAQTGAMANPTALAPQPCTVSARPLAD
jgi:large exoprotein involved in heme utilization and adhesion